MNQIEKALRLYEEAREDLFTQCLSNPIQNAWGKQVNLAKLNQAHEAAIAALRGTESSESPADKTPPKVSLFLPDGDDRKARVWWSEMKDGVLELSISVNESREISCDPVGEAGAMPGTAGVTVAFFKAEDVPLGTKLYTGIDRK